MLNIVFLLMIIVTLVVSYFVWVRPLLKKTPRFKALLDEHDTRFAAISAKFDGIKQRLTHAFLIIAGLVVTMYDSVAPSITGIDVTPITSALAKYVPTWSWPLILIGIVSLLDYFRSLADKQRNPTV